MTVFITLISIILFIILFALILNKLDFLEINKKILICITTLIICFVFTFIIYSISSNGIEYQNTEQKSITTATFVSIFAPINGIIFIPYWVKLKIDTQSGKLDKIQAKKRLIIMLFILIIGIIIEINYLKNVQLGIIEYSK